MGKQVTITAKIPAPLKRRLAKLGVNVSELVRESLEMEVKRLERERFRRLAREAGVILQKIPAEEIVESIRAGRSAR